MVNEYAILDNVEIMVSFTFKPEDIDNMYYKSLNFHSLITDVCKSKGMILDFDTVCRNSYVNFKVAKKKGRSETVLFHFNPLRTLRKELQDTTGEVFGSGLNGDTNFINVEKYPFTTDFQNKTLSDAYTKLLSIIEVCKAIYNSRTLKDFDFKPHIKLSLLKLEAVIDKGYSTEVINMYHNVLVQNYHAIMSKYHRDLRLHTPNNTVKNQCFYLSINTIQDENENLKIFEKVGQVYLKTGKILRFEHSRNLQDKRYHNCHSKQRFTAILNVESDAAIIERFKLYLQTHLNNTQELYQKSMLLTELMINNH